MHALIYTDRQLLMVIELMHASCYSHVMWCFRRVTEDKDTWQHEWQPLCVSLSLLAIFLSC